MQRKPSHLGSYRKSPALPPLVGSSRASLASIGDTGGSIGNTVASVGAAHEGHQLGLVDGVG